MLSQLLEVYNVLLSGRLHFHFSLSCIGEGYGNPLQYSCLENPRDRGAWWAAVYGVAQSRTWLKQLSSSSRVNLPQLLFKAVLPILAPLAYQVLENFVDFKLNCQEKLTFYNIKSSYSWTSVQFSHSVVSDCVRPHELQHARPPCPSPTPGVHSNSHPSSRWCHSAISSSVVPFSSYPHRPWDSPGKSTGVGCHWEIRKIWIRKLGPTERASKKE